MLLRNSEFAPKSGITELTTTGKTVNKISTQQSSPKLWEKISKLWEKNPRLWEKSPTAWDFGGKNYYLTLTRLY
jgi:hypothetical protein